MSKNELLKLKVSNLILSLILGNYSVVNNEYEEGIKPVLNEVTKYLSTIRNLSIDDIILLHTDGITKAFEINEYLLKIDCLKLE